MVAVRMSGTRSIDLDCPRCGLPLPPIMLEFDTRADGPRTLTVQIREPVLTDEWWQQLDATHPGCRSGDAARWSPPEPSRRPRGDG